MVAVRMNSLAETLVYALGCATGLVLRACRCLTAELTGLNVAARWAENGGGIDEDLAGAVHVEVRGRARG